MKQPSRSILNGRIICAIHNPRQEQRAVRRDDRLRRVDIEPRPGREELPGPAPAVLVAAGSAPLAASEAEPPPAVPIAAGPATLAASEAEPPSAVPVAAGSAALAASEAEPPGPISPGDNGPAVGDGGSVITDPVDRSGEDTPTAS